MKAIDFKKKFILFCLVLMACIAPFLAKAQDTLEEPSTIIEQQLEDITAANEDVETDDDAYLQQLHRFLKEPINLNSADAGLLEQLNMFSPLQIADFLAYRKLLGNFLSIYELQAIPSWNLDLIRRVRPYITVAQKTEVFKSLHQRLQKGDQTLLVRSSQILEKSKGYLLDSSEAKNFYPGSPQKLLLRYKYRSGNLLQYGFTAEKDAGEQFFKGRQKEGFDFYSAHFFVRNLGVIKSLAVGDFAVNLGQGLTEWQSLAFNKGAEITNIKRQSEVLRPYNSAGEIEFNRGAGITLQKKRWETTVFASYRKVDASVTTELNNEEFVSSLQSSGYHRTENEIAGRHAEGLFSAGGNISYSNDKVHLGVNGVRYHFKYPVQKAAYLYNVYTLNGKTAGNYSFDYSFTQKNMHVFGEAAIDERLNKAFVNGLLINTDLNVTMSFLYRNISKGYESLYSNAFTENTNTVNESGLYSGIMITPGSSLKIDAYADFFHFPWLKYRTDAPTSGNEYMVQLFYEPNKEVELTCRYRYQNKPINYNPSDLTLNPVAGRPKKAFRSQLNYKLNSTFTLRSRFELVWLDDHGSSVQQKGFLTFVDLIFKPSLKQLSGNIRLSYFETDGYDSRIYAFENDVLYSYSIPVFYDKGYRYYINLHYKLGKKINLWARFAQTIYSDKTVIGSGLDAIQGNRKTEVKVEMIYTF